MSSCMRLKKIVITETIMNLHKIFYVFRKEILDLFRDRKTIIMMIMVPLLMYPVLFSVMTTVQSKSFQKMEQGKSRVAVQPGAPEDLLTMIRNNDRLTLASSEDFKADIKEKTIQCYLGITAEGGKTAYTIYYDGAWQLSTMARQRLKELMDRYL